MMCAAFGGLFGLTAMPVLTAVFSKIIKGFRKGEMNLFTGGTGSGKDRFRG